MKIEWVVTDVTVVGSSDRAECAILEVILAWRSFDQFRPFFDQGATLWCRNLPIEP